MQVRYNRDAWSSPALPEPTTHVCERKEKKTKQKTWQIYVSLRGSTPATSLAHITARDPLHLCKIHVRVYIDRSTSRLELSIGQQHQQSRPQRWLLRKMARRGEIRFMIVLQSTHAAHKLYIIYFRHVRTIWFLCCNCYYCLAVAQVIFNWRPIWSMIMHFTSPRICDLISDFFFLLLHWIVCPISGHFIDFGRNA